MGKVASSGQGILLVPLVASYAGLASSSANYTFWRRLRAWEIAIFSCVARTLVIVAVVVAIVIGVLGVLGVVNI